MVRRRPRGVACELWTVHTATEPSREVDRCVDWKPAIADGRHQRCLMRARARTRGRMRAMPAHVDNVGAGIKGRSIARKIIEAFDGPSVDPRVPTPVLTCNPV